MLALQHCSHMPIFFSPSFSIYLSCSISLSVSLSLDRETMAEVRSSCSGHHLEAYASRTHLEGAEMVDPSSIATQMQWWWRVIDVWQSRSFMAVKHRPLVSLTTTLGPNKLISTSSSKWYLPFSMKVPGSLTHIFV